MKVDLYAKPTLIELRRTFSAPRGKVYRAWADHKTLSKWFAPSEDQSVEIEPVPAHLGNRYQITLTDKNGVEHSLTGVYDRVEEPDLLGFTWAWEGADYFGENAVLIQFKDVDGDTEISLLHKFFPGDKLMKAHKKDWEARLDRLEKVLK